MLIFSQAIEHVLLLSFFTHIKSYLMHGGRLSVQRPQHGYPPFRADLEVTAWVGPLEHREYYPPVASLVRISSRECLY